MPRTNVDMVTNLYRRFNDFVRGELHRQRRTQGDLALYLGVERSTITNRLNGIIKWNLRDVIKTLEFLDADLKEVMELIENHIEERRITHESI